MGCKPSRFDTLNSIRPVGNTGCGLDERYQVNGVARRQVDRLPIGRRERIRAIRHVAYRTDRQMADFRGRRHPTQGGPAMAGRSSISSRTWRRSMPTHNRRKGGLLLSRPERLFTTQMLLGRGYPYIYSHATANASLPSSLRVRRQRRSHWRSTGRRKSGGKPILAGRCLVHPGAARAARHDRCSATARRLARQD